MAYPGSYKKGDHRAACMVCGQVFLASQMRMRWDNLFVCQADFEVRHPQDFVRGVPDDMRAEPVRVRPDPTYVDPDTFGGYLQEFNNSGSVGYLLQFNGYRLIRQVDE